MILKIPQNVAWASRRSMGILPMSLTGVPPVLMPQNMGKMPM
jgi:hypothetical protein